MGVKHEFGEDISENRQSIPLIFKGDLVKKKGEKRIGIVTEVLEDEGSHLEGFDSNAKHHVMVLWDALEEASEEIVEYDYELIVVDRSFHPGQCVAAAADPTGQIGVALKIQKSIDLKGDEYEIEKMSCNDISRVREFELYDSVILGAWLGTVRDFSENVTVKLTNGSVCKVLEASLCSLKPNKEPLNENMTYYPGQRVNAGISSIGFQNIQWITNPCQGDLIEGKVSKIDFGPLYISWFASADANNSVVPDEEQSPSKLTRLSCFNEMDWAYGSVCLLSKIDEGSGTPFFIQNLNSKVDVSWQDGSITRDLDSACLIPRLGVGDNEFLPEQFVLKATFDGNCKLAGLVKSVDARARTACVRWLKPFDEVEEEVVSVYEIEHDPENNYYIGAKVVRVPDKVDHYELNFSESSYLSCFGSIIGIKNGIIQVTWADGTLSEVGPREIKVVAYDFDEEPISDSKRVFETEEHTEYIATEAFKGLEIVSDVCILTPTISGFDCAKDPSDHKFLSKNVQNFGKRWIMKIKQDSKILKSSLPEGIYIRVYEDRADLWRAAIVGPHGTPYQNGLFIFDFYLPPEYPNVPPLVHYHSGGWKLNPNLYEDGKVCLSLLNTWSGREDEMWNPAQSTMLQVLVSLQALVLNSRPYFNEAGYDLLAGTLEGEKNSVSYNEHAFLMNCKLMMHLIRNPPKDFEDIVSEHFKARGKYILKACAGYLDSNTDGSSVGFTIALQNDAARLFTALKGVGADCDEFEDLAHV